ncbi:hypothetical protein M441DRAFT_48259 [Trichoderma asperellum CBS 433.97]|uniref:Uncharacterized protein n=1 Tax=Trichoderma asperellum (strain ATCC 204424 / CBS 433.97 / NBRC 101777) TaxID=1042311 RepID=A0A2T3Z6I4_TRIA4|nr:hypothetical protein M441DRAFT_48259 [Trichoderma asperellum CBS 433.97]PTB40418.1 hypothetical protein M441DRAFT_48259 [Trichoderma asperellum CBS 433.97]
MSQSYNWPNDDETDSQSPNSPSSSEESQPATTAVRSRLRPAGKHPASLPSADQVSDTSDEEDRTISYNIQWKLSINHRKRGGCSELGVVTPIRIFWRDVLEAKLDKAVKKLKKSCEASSTEIVLSTTHHGTHPITLSFDELDIDWQSVDRQRKEWTKLPTSRKKRSVVTISVTFEYTFVDTDKNPSAAASAAQLHNIRARYGDGTSMTRSVAVGKSYALMRCSGPPCKNGDHCWQYEGRHIRLFPHHIDILVDHLHAGRTLNGHHDVPETFRRLVLADERQQKEREEKQREKDQQRKRNRQGSDGVSTSLCHPHQCSYGGRSTPEVVFPASPLLSLGEPRRDLLKAYDVWQIYQASDDEESYLCIQHLNLERKYDLEMIVSNQQRVFQYYLDNDVPEGVAWHYVSDIKAFYKLRREEHAKNAP